MKLKGFVKTYSGWLLECIDQGLVLENFEKKGANFTASGVEAIFADTRDRQLYKIIIEPLYETDDLGK